MGADYFKIVHYCVFDALIAYSNNMEHSSLDSGGNCRGGTRSNRLLTDDNICPPVASLRDKYFESRKCLPIKSVN